MPIISETTRSFAWLLENDAAGWVIGSHAVAHRGAQVGLWTANGLFFYEIFYDVPERDCDTGHVLTGKSVKLNFIDKIFVSRALRRSGRNGGTRVQQKISDFAERRFNLEKSAHSSHD